RQENPRKKGTCGKPSAPPSKSSRIRTFVARSCARPLTRWAGGGSASTGCGQPLRGRNPSTEREDLHDWMEIDGCETCSDGGPADRRHRRVSCPRRSRQRERSSDDGPWISRRRLLAWELRAGLPPRSQPEWEGLRGSREREGQ